MKQGEKLGQQNSKILLEIVPKVSCLLDLKTSLEETLD